MSNNYGLILLLGSLFTAIIWLLDVFWLKSVRQKKAVDYESAKTTETIEKTEIESILKEPLLVDFSRSFFPIIFIILLIRSFLYEPFQIPSGSMKPTLLVGDFIIVEKFSYGLRLSGFRKLLYETGHPDYGDVVVFHYPLDPTDTYIKRIVGLPGDKITYLNKKIEIETSCITDNLKSDNDHCSNKIQIAQSLLADSAYNDDGNMVDIYQEKLGSEWHEMLLDPKVVDLQETNQWQVPVGHYFVMGDNRDKSSDSRFWGFVSEDQLVGKAVAVWLHMEFNNEWFDWIPSEISFHTVGRIR